MTGNIQENIYQAIDIITSQKLAGLKYDQTIICEIMDDSEAKLGKYSVSENGRDIFDAFSLDKSLKRKEQVCVTVPNGDYSQQKIITGRYLTEQSAFYSFVSPMDSFLNITENIVPEANRKEFKVLANDNARGAQTGVAANVDSRKGTVQNIWNIKGCSYTGYDRLGISADFETWLKPYKCVGGTFGVRLTLTVSDKPEVETESLMYISCDLSVKDMYGNPYNYDVYYNQEKVFDISGIQQKTIVGMSLDLYQDEDFVNEMHGAVPFMGTERKLSPNIHVKNCFVSFGYDISKYTDDALLINTFDSVLYDNKLSSDKNKKRLLLRWVHTDTEEQKNYAIDEDHERPEGSLIRWYRFDSDMKKDIEPDPYAGAFWEEITQGRNRLECEVLPDTMENVNSYKVIVEYPSRDYVEQIIATDEYFVTMAERINQPGVAKEEIDEYEARVNALRGSVKVIESAVFELKSATPMADKATLDSIQSLMIECDVDGYKGNYLLYNLSNQLQNPNEGRQLRKMTAKYTSLITKDNDLGNADSITWKFPLNNTMIVKPEETVYSDPDKKNIRYKREYVLDGNTRVFEDTTDNTFCIRRYRSDQGDGNLSGELGTAREFTADQMFRIKDYYMESATNNTIKCIVEKDNVSYMASYELTFGPMGTNGTDYTFRMTFESNVPALTKGHTTPQNKVRVDFSLYDYHNETIANFEQNGINLKWFARDGHSIIGVYKADGTEITNNLADSNGITIKDRYIWLALKNSNVPGCNIIQARVLAKPTSGGGTELGKDIRLETFFPIPWRNSVDLTGIEGSTMIVYDATGTKPQYYKKRYQVLEADGPLSLGWRIHIPDGEAAKFYPQFDSESFLKPTSMFIQGLKPDVYATCGPDADIHWVQPIMIMQDAYASALLNSWDGNLTIDEKNGTILSTMIGAGYKNEYNQYFGVLMGKIGASKSETGIFGYSQGVQSFGFKVDGTAFIGKKGQGQIIFNGNNGTIKSGNYKAGESGMCIDLDGDGKTSNDEYGNPSSNGCSLKAYGGGGAFELDTSSSSTALLRIKDAPKNGNVLFQISTEQDGDGNNVTSSYYLQSSNFSTSGKTRGTKLDLQNGKFTTYGPGGAIFIDSSKDDGLFIVRDKNNQSLLTIGNQTYKLKSSNFANGSGMEINLATGRITAYTFYLHAGTGDNTIIMNSIDGAIPFKIGTKFKVAWDGSVTADYITAKTGGRIGPFTINETYLGYNSTGYQKGTFYVGQSGISLNGDTFYVDSLGNTRIAGTLNVNGKTTVTNDLKVTGKIYCGAGEKVYKFDGNGGNIGPWSINEEGIKSSDGNSVLNPGGTMKLQSKNMILDFSDYALRVQHTSGDPYMSISSYGIKIKSGNNVIDMGDTAKFSSSAGYVSISSVSVSLMSSGFSGGFITTAEDTVMRHGDNRIKINGSGIEVKSSKGSGTGVNGTFKVRNSAFLQPDVELEFVNGLLVNSTAIPNGDKDFTPTEPTTTP